MGWDPLSYKQSPNPPYHKFPDLHLRTFFERHKSSEGYHIYRTRWENDFSFLCRMMRDHDNGKLDWHHCVTGELCYDYSPIRNEKYLKEIGMITMYKQLVQKTNKVRKGQHIRRFLNEKELHRRNKKRKNNRRV
jgi:hypothetical protein